MSVCPLLPALWLPVCGVVACAYLYAIFGRLFIRIRWNG